MKSKTDPKTHKSVAILSQQDVTAICRTIDVLNGITLIEDCHGFAQLAADLRKAISGRTATEVSAKEAGDGVS